LRRHHHGQDLQKRREGKAGGESPSTEERREKRKKRRNVEKVKTKGGKVRCTGTSGGGLKGERKEGSTKNSKELFTIFLSNETGKKGVWKGNQRGAQSFGIVTA